MAGNRRWQRLIGLLFVFSIWGASAVLAAVPAEINYQGRIEDLSGPVDGLLDLTFRLFDADVAGTIVWEEVHSVLVNQGIYNVILGTGALNPSYGSLEEAVFGNDDLWLEVQVAGEADAMVPRQKLTSVGFALRAGSVSDGTITATMLADDAVTTDKLVDGAVTAAKVTGGFVPNLDADLLDGLSATAFATAGHTHDTRYYTQAEVDAMINGLQGEIDALKALLLGVTRAGNDITFSGVNLHVVSGSGATEGAVNGLGNLIVGYNELPGSDYDRSGSHNIVVGRRHNYSSYGGLVVGNSNSILGRYASVSGGTSNTASGDYASVSGGQSNRASGSGASVSGGGYNTSSGQNASVSGGDMSTASGYKASVSGGRINWASGDYASVSGGGDNTSSGDSASVSGGLSNIAIGLSTSVGGGDSNMATSRCASVSGGRYNTASGDYAFIGGGGGSTATDGNQAFGHYSSILGGFKNIAGDPLLSDNTIGQRSAISGGLENKTTGEGASVGGGWRNTASGAEANVSGGFQNDAQGPRSSISGGKNNVAIGADASVSGGDSNTASADSSIIVGDTDRVYVDNFLIH